MREWPEERPRGFEVQESQGSQRSLRHRAGRSPNGPLVVARTLSSVTKETDPRG